MFAGSSITNINKQLSSHLNFLRKIIILFIFWEDTGIDVPFVDQVIDFDFFDNLGFLREQKMMKQIQQLWKAMLLWFLMKIFGYLTRMAGRSSFRKFERPKMFHLSSEYPFYENSNGSLEKIFWKTEKSGKTTDLLIISNETDFHIAEKYGFSQDTVQWTEIFWEVIPTHKGPYCCSLW